MYKKPASAVQRHPAKILHPQPAAMIFSMSQFKWKSPSAPLFFDAPPPSFGGKETIGSIGSILSFHRPRSSGIIFSNTCLTAVDATTSITLKDSSPMTPADHTLPPCPNVCDSSQDGATTLLEKSPDLEVSLGSSLLITHSQASLSFKCPIPSALQLEQIPNTSFFLATICVRRKHRLEAAQPSRPRVAAPPRPSPGPLHPHSALWKLVEMINPGEGRQVLVQACWSTLAEVDPDTGELEGLLGLPGVTEEIQGVGFKSFNCWGWGGGSNGCPYRGQVQLLAPTLCGSRVSSRQFHGIQCPRNCFLSPQVASMHLSRSSK